ncbi:Txe/YoeB family addiction module toxin [Lapidilactobacillus bayanensis]|uniref:Txe/YoeB family addiction module toxin n=1 Tax=Lapidilactobacillus bayanensis TaxID=2485998 RepID=UPI000F7AEA3F|nr:Txe/YoeB family addiction module toxin [Lapidilactobacillus bayanensis]
MKSILWSADAWEEYLTWQNEDRKTLKRINAIIKDIQRNGAQGIGKSEKLRGGLTGWYSRRIDKVNRIVFRINHDQLEIVQVKTQYQLKH